MPYEMLERQIRAIPEEYFPDIAQFLELLQYKIIAQSKMATETQIRPRRKLGGFEGKIRIVDDLEEEIL